MYLEIHVLQGIKTLPIYYKIKIKTNNSQV